MIFDIWFYINLQFFYSKYDKNGKKALKIIFELSYPYIKSKLIKSITAKIKLLLETIARNNYYDKYPLA